MSAPMITTSTNSTMEQSESAKKINERFGAKGLETEDETRKNDRNVVKKRGFDGALEVCGVEVEELRPSRS
jgi:hypothetical protein